VAKRYRVSQDVSFDLVSLAHQEGNRFQLDPLLIIAVIAIESRFNPIAESGAGAKGLMQIIPKYHTDKLEEFGGEQAVFDPATNIQVGSRILREYIRRTGNIGIALQMYAGALGDTEDQYTTKVLNERRRLQQVLSSPPRASSPGA
jgi:soluble lytic murein transglycosylase-like protein